MGKAAKIWIWVLIVAVIGLGIGLIVVNGQVSTGKQAETDLKAANDKLTKAEAELKAANEELAALKDEQPPEDELAALTEELIKAKADLEAAQAEVDALKAEQPSEGELAALTEELTKAQADLDAAQADLVAAQGALDAAQGALTAKEAELALALDEVEALTGQLASAAAEEEKKQDEEPAIVEEAAKAAAAKVTIWHTFTGDQDAMLNEIAAEFNAGQGEIEVIVQSQPYQGFEGNVQSAVANGVGPDIIFNYASTAADYVNEGKVADLTKYIEEEGIIPGFKDSLPEGIYNEANGFTDGRMHAIAAVTTGPILFYNKTLYDELGLKAPATWTELAENSKAIFEAKGIPGYAVDSLTDQMQMLILQNGSGYIDVENKVVLFNNEAAAAALNWLADGVKEGYFSLTPSTDYWSNDFSAGLVGSYIGSCAGIPYITPDGFEFDVAPAPQEGSVKWYPSWNRGPIVFSSDEATERAAVTFLAYFLSPDNNFKWAKAMIALSPYAGTNSLPEYAEFVAANPALGAVAESLPHAGFLPSVPGAYTVRTELTRIAKLVAGDIMTAEDALAEAEAICNEALQE